MGAVLYACVNISIDICQDSKLSDLDYVDDVIPLSEYPSQLRVILDCLDNSLAAYGIRFTYHV